MAPDYVGVDLGRVKWEGLYSYAPGGKENCLCGSGFKYKNCCKDEWPKYDYRVGEVRPRTAIQKLKKLRAHITWYRLCHLAHTVRDMHSGKDATKMLELDLSSMQGMTRKALSLYESCHCADDYPLMLHQLSGAIADERWAWFLCAEEALFFLAFKSDRARARSVMAKFRWQDVENSEFLEVYLDVHSGLLGHVDVVAIASKVVDLTGCASSRFQYRFIIAVQYFLHNEAGRAEKLARQAITDFEQTRVEERTAYGRVLLARGYMHLGEILADEQMLAKAIELLLLECDDDRFTSEATADFLCDVGQCYFALKKYYLAEKYYSKSISVCNPPLANVYLGKVQVYLGRLDRARGIFAELDLVKMSPVNYFDYSIVVCELALRTQVPSDISKALDMIKSVRANDPYFMGVVQELIVALYELPKKNVSRIVSIIAAINKYVTLNPNFNGVGVDINSMINDYLNRRK